MPNKLPDAALTSPWYSRRGVRASAGSGKTYQLTGHYLRAFLEGAEPAAMLATTFTRKAAGEILGRVLLRLGQAAIDAPQATKLGDELGLPGFDIEAAQAQMLRLCRALHLVSISTIDSFFAQLLRAYRYDLGLPANLRMVNSDSPEMLALRVEAMRRLFATADRAQVLLLLDALHEGAAHRGVASRLGGQLNTAHQLFETAPRAAWLTEPRPYKPLTEAEVSQLAAAIAGYADKAPTQIAKAMRNDVESIRAEQWARFVEKGLAEKVRTGENTYYKKPILDEWSETYMPLVTHAHAVLYGKLAARNSALVRMLTLYHEAYLAVRQSAGIYQFHDVPLALSRLLPGQTDDDIAHRMDGRLEYLLLDEFQDTDPRQYAILKPFAACIHNEDAGRGLLFCVGDQKQSIYGWRGGVPAIFESLQGDFAALQWEDNDRSYRSSQVVLDAVNALFSDLNNNPVLQARHPAAALRWSQRFRAHTACKNLPGYFELLESPPPAPGVALGEDETAVDMGGDSEEGGATPVVDTHLQFVAERIARLVSDAPDCSIGVLLRKNDTVLRLMLLLRRCGVIASAEGGSSIVDDPAVALLLAALQFADHPGDSVARFHLTNSPLAGPLRLAGPRALPHDQASYELRRLLLQDGYAAALAAWAACLAPGCDQRGAYYLDQLVELAEAYSGPPVARPAEFAAYLRAEKVEEFRPAGVRVMTIHKAKGLEFDAVVLPELHRQLLRQGGFRLVYARDKRTLEISVISIYPGKLAQLDDELGQICTEYEQAEIEEALCLLYVAMTRPRYALHIIVPPFKLSKKGESVRTYTLATILRAGLEGQNSAVSADGEVGGRLSSAGDAAWYAQLPEAAPPVAATPPAPTTPPDAAAVHPAVRSGPAGPPRFLRRLTPSTAVSGRVSAGDVLGNSGRGVRLRGSALHAYLALAPYSGEPLPPDELLLQAAQAAVPLAATEELVHQLQNFKQLLLMPFVAASLVPPSLAPGEDAELWRERRFAVAIAEAFISGTFDRAHVVYAHRRPVRATLLDYKTGRAGHQPGSEAAAGAAVQIQTYRRALCAMLGLEPAQVTATLLYTHTGQTVDVAPPADI